MLNCSIDFALANVSSRFFSLGQSFKKDYAHVLVHWSARAVELDMVMGEWHCITLPVAAILMSLWALDAL